MGFMLALAFSADITRAELLNVHTERASNFVLGVMDRVIDRSNLWDKKDRCLGIAEVDSNFIDSEVFTNCLLGTKPKPAPRQASKPKITTDTKTQDAGNLADTAKVDPVWADDTRKRIAGKKDDTVEVAEMETNAPYGDGKCQLFKPAANRGQIDWDWVTVTNRCSYPVAILACFYNIGEERDCLPGGKGSWGLINLGPGQSGTTIATAKRMPWLVKGWVCNMTPIKHNRMLCVLPKNYRT